MAFGFIFVLMCIGMILLSKKLLRSYFAPLGLFNMVWGLSFSLLTITTLSDYPLSCAAWLAIFGVWFSFGLGSITVGLAWQSRARSGKIGKYQASGVRERGLFLPEKYRAAMTLVGMLSVLGALHFDYLVLKRVGISAWLTNPQSLRFLLTWGEFDTGIMTHVFRATNMVAAAMGGVWVLHDYRHFPAYFGVLAAALSDLVFLGRSHTLIVAGIFFASIYLSYQAKPNNNTLGLPRRFRFRRVMSKKLVVFVLITFVVFVLPFSRISTIRNAPGKYTESPLNAMMPFVINLSQNWYAVDYVVHHETKLAMGSNTFYVPKYILYRAGIVKRDPRLDRLYNYFAPIRLGNPTNTYTIVGAIYKDFGYIGLLLLPYLIAVLMNHVYVYYTIKPKLWTLYALSFVPSYMFFTVQGDQLSSPSFNFGLIAAITLGLYMQRSNRDEHYSHIHHMTPSWNEH